MRGIGVEDDESDAVTTVTEDLTEGSNTNICLDSDELCEEEIKPRDGPSKILYEGEGACAKALAGAVEERRSGVSDSAVTKDDEARRRPPRPISKSRANRLDLSPPSEGQTVCGANRPDPLQGQRGEDRTVCGANRPDLLQGQRDEGQTVCKANRPDPSQGQRDKDQTVCGASRPDPSQGQRDEGQTVCRANRPAPLQGQRDEG